MAGRLVFIDSEVGIDDKKIHDLGAVRDDGAVYHSGDLGGFLSFVSGAEFVCGHNIVHHDIRYIEAASGRTLKNTAIDTLYLSPLLFPKRPYHSLLKDDKLQTDELNNPVNDCRKASDLFYDEVNVFNALSPDIKRIYYSLLSSGPEFFGFFKYVGCRPFMVNAVRLIRKEFAGRICSNADIAGLVRNRPVETAYALALISSDDRYSITPPWLLRNFPAIENVLQALCGRRCAVGCEYCRREFDIHSNLKRFFGYDDFRTFDGEPLQEKAAQAAVDGKSLLAVFPTGGGKSLTFQLPALMAGRAVHGLTVVISPLQSLMKDQVDNLNKAGITEAVTVNGLLDPIERANSLERVANGSASILYISPEQLRSRTIERLLLSRTIARFVIDEAHCFSAWGQDFRVDYLYIGDFIRGLSRKKEMTAGIPVSCFTATAKQKVITDICDYFKRKLDLNLEVFASSSVRENLHYTVLYKETDEDKYLALRDLIAGKRCPTIVYVSRTRRSVQIAEKLTRDGYPALPFNGRMEAEEKTVNQDAFISNRVGIIVATSAFGMGVDKKDVGLVVHYDISSSLEDYIQESGRAGRSSALTADCYVLYNDGDLDRHFLLLNQTKLSMSEIQQVWKAVKDLTKQRASVSCSPLEIARQAGWDQSVSEVESRVKTAIAALENAGYVKRGENMPHVYADSITVANMAQASARIEASALFSDRQRKIAKRIIKSLISCRSISKDNSADAESRVDYLADILGLSTQEVICTVNLMRQEGLLSDAKDMSAFIYTSDTENRSARILAYFAKLEGFLLSRLPENGDEFNLKELNEQALSEGIEKASVKNMRTLIYFYTIKDFIRKPEYRTPQTVRLVPSMEVKKLAEKYHLRLELCSFILSRLYSDAHKKTVSTDEGRPVEFSLIGLFDEYRDDPQHAFFADQVTVSDVEDALLYLSKIGALKLEGGFLVLYNAMDIKRISGMRTRYKGEDYRFLDEFYRQKIRQIHIVGEFANLMVRDYEAALRFVSDYFQMDFQKFISKYFAGERKSDLNRNITPGKYNQLFGKLSLEQLDIIKDAESKYIVVAAGPGSGKTMVLVHKLASLLLMEDVKHEQLLMLTFSRAAATEFKKRLMELIGNAAHFVEIKTFHSYCFDLLDRPGSLEGAKDVVGDAVELINSGNVEQGKITKSVLVIDEAQDMDENEFELVRALMRQNPDMRVIAVGDDDQNIYEFRGSSSKYLRSLTEDYGAVKYELTENFRSGSSIVELSNAFASCIRDRMKTSPITAYREEKGTVVITRHTAGGHMEEAVVSELAGNHTSETCCVLTNTNDEALQIQGLLRKKGIDGKLIQSMDGFNLYNLAEIRIFLKKIDASLNAPVIPDGLWKEAKEYLCGKYSKSSCLEIVLRLLDDFEAVNKKKYRSDLDEFIKESKLEDFCGGESGTIYVSTIHKAKGREFDAVYMMLDGNRAASEEEKRKLYVGMTRVKNELYIHVNTDLFARYKDISGVGFRFDPVSYGEPAEIALQLTFRDVVLDYFKDKTETISKLRSGDELIWKAHYLYLDRDGKATRVVRLSGKCRDRLDGLIDKGYLPYRAEIGYIVGWKADQDSRESAVILPNIYLRR